MSRPGELVHVDVKKLGRIPKGGGWRVNGASRREGPLAQDEGRVCLRALGRRRLLPVGLLRGRSTTSRARPPPGSGAGPSSSSLTRASSSNGSSPTTGPCYRSHDFRTRRSATPIHSFTRPYRPQTNGKVERFNRTLLAEWAYVRTWTSEGQRTRALARWLHIYNHHRHHTAIGGPPVSRAGNVSGHYS